MARTLRNTPYNGPMFRGPKTSNEIRQLMGILTDIKIENNNISGVTRIRARKNYLPDRWDDIVCSSFYQNYTC
jgi:hypothetical protein